MPKEDSEIFQGYSAINPNINDDKPGSGNQQTDKVKFRTSRRRKPKPFKSSRNNLGEYFLNNILGNNQQGISNNRGSYTNHVDHFLAFFDPPSPMWT